MTVLIDFLSSFEVLVPFEFVLLNGISGIKNHKNLVFPLSIPDHLPRPWSLVHKIIFHRLNKLPPVLNERLLFELIFAESQVLSNLQIRVLVHRLLVNFVDRLPAIVLAFGVCFEAEQELDDSHVTLTDCKAQGWATCQVLKVDSRKLLEQKPCHFFIVPLNSPNETTLLHFVKLEHN